MYQWLMTQKSAVENQRTKEQFTDQLDERKTASISNTNSQISGDKWTILRIVEYHEKRHIQLIKHMQKF